MTRIPHEITSRLPAILATVGDAQPATTLKVRPISPRSRDRYRARWEVLDAGAEEERLFAGGKGKAIDHAVERLSGADGGEVLVLNFLGELFEKARVPAQPLGTRAEIMKMARELHRTGPLRIAPFCVDISSGMPHDEGEFAAALSFLWHGQQGDFLWADVDEGTACQYGRFVFLTKQGFTFGLEQYESTALAMRRLVEFAYAPPDDPRRPAPQPLVYRSGDRPLPVLAEEAFGER